MAGLVLDGKGVTVNCLGPLFTILSHTSTNDGMAQLLLGGIGSSATRRLALAASSDWNKNRTHLEGDRDPSTPNPIG